MNHPTEITHLHPAFVDMHGACSYTSLSRRTLDYAKGGGELPHYKLGKKVVFKVSDLDQWMGRYRIDVSGTVRTLEGGQSNE